MTKKTAAEFNMAEEIRALLNKDSGMTGREVESALKKKFPRKKINPNSCGVAFSNARKKLGLRKSISSGRSFASNGSIDVSVLHAAKQYLAKCGGDEGRAFAVLKQLSDLQV